MRIRLGYVAIALNLKNITSSSTVTFANYNKLKSEDEKLSKLKRVTFSNIDDLEKILKYNIENNIHFYRLTSKLIPLSTHPEVTWDYENYFSKELRAIGKIIKSSNMRVDAHPDQFNVINSVKDKVVKDTIRNLNHAVDLFDLMNYDEGKLVIHIGSSVGGKEDSIHRFISNYKTFPRRIRERLILENDDKVFTAKDVFRICEEIEVPMVLDVHHHNCKNNEENMKDLLPHIFSTWDSESLPPKIHFSSPKEGKLDRKHADYIDVNDFCGFLDLAKENVNRDFDVMIEAKKKDQAILKLMRNLRKINYNCKFIDNSTI
ncbi:UV DNA damage repair endonuclease UvsE [Terrisporobacter mayombei]|uniref:UV DNA damage endonuclease n=1 Tax=Terrisporobacter mayombei TaxID=1541 RepID=A0ABY9Q076_9FIRM|nr:UV DNA damage repair endonuclease UvsE [Terrisporobacter mayombei]MCC3868440.1 UV DNA damage repair endonuclease UvsE [Terrisporobacter mayombei]WMT80591.1 UV DNA damage endonuclease [Terrisporobacter mayombei]